MFGSMSSYAVVWIDPACKNHTCVAEHTGSSPAWDYCLHLPVHGSSICGTTSGGNGALITGTATSANNEDDEGNERLTIQIYSKGAVSDELVGTAHIPLQDIIKNAADKLEYMACQLVRPSGRIQGLVNLSIRYTSSTKNSPAHPHQEPPGHSNMSKQHGTNRDSWFFLSESMDEEEGTTGHEAGGGSGGAALIAAPDYLDFRDGEGGAGGGGGSGGGGRASRSSSSSAAESTFVGSPHSLENSSGQSDVPIRSMFDNTFDALALADAAVDLTQHGGVSLVHPQSGSSGVSVGDALLGLVMSQPSNPPSQGG